MSTAIPNVLPSRGPTGAHGFRCSSLTAALSTAAKPATSTAQRHAPCAIRTQRYSCRSMRLSLRALGLNASGGLDEQAVGISENAGMKDRAHSHGFATGAGHGDAIRFEM